MPGRFEVYEDKAGKWRFRLKASNGQIVAAGEAYETKAAAKRGTESVQAAAGPVADGITIVDLTESRGADHVRDATEKPRAGVPSSRNDLDTREWRVETHEVHNGVPMALLHLVALNDDGSTERLAAARDDNPARRRSLHQIVAEHAMLSAPYADDQHQGGHWLDVLPQKPRWARAGNLLMATPDEPPIGSTVEIRVGDAEQRWISVDDPRSAPDARRDRRWAPADEPDAHAIDRLGWRAVCRAAIGGELRLIHTGPLVVDHQPEAGETR